MRCRIGIHFCTTSCSATWAHDFDVLGGLVSQTAPESLPSVYSWDEASRLVSVAQPGGDCASTPVVDCVTYSYDPAGRPTGVDHFWALLTDPWVSFGRGALVGGCRG